MIRISPLVEFGSPNPLFLPNQHANRGSLESILLAELVLEKAEVGRRDIVRVTDKQRKDRWLCRDLIETIVVRAATMWIASSDGDRPLRATRGAFAASNFLTCLAEGITVHTCLSVHLVT